MISGRIKSDDPQRTMEELVEEVEELRERLRSMDIKVQDKKEKDETDYKELVQCANSIFIELDANGVIKFINRYAQSFFGYSEEELVGKNVIGTIVPATDKSGKDLSSMVVDILADPDAYVKNENENILRNGQRVWISWTNKPIFDDDGRLKKILCVGNDITRRKKAEEALDYERSQLLSIFDSIDEVIYVTDTETCEILYANKAMKKKFGKELIGGICYREFQNRESKCDFCTNPIILKEKGTPYRWEYHNPTVDKDFLIVDRIIKWPDGRDVRFELAIDITQQKRAEKSLNDAKTSAELYLDLMSHDINNINHAVLGYLEMAQERIDLKVEERELISKPIELIHNTSKLIDNLKKLQAVRSSKPSLYAVNVGEMIEKVVQRYRARPGRDVEIRYEPVINCHVTANGMLEDVLSNLVENSVKHSSGRVIIDIKARKVENGKKTSVIITLEDNGPGMPDELKEKVFSIAYEEISRLSRRGLGLRLVKAIIDSFSGKISVEDRIRGDRGKGCRFIMTLPAA